MKKAYQIDERKAIDRFHSYLTTNPGTSSWFCRWPTWRSGSVKESRRCYSTAKWNCSL